MQRNLLTEEVENAESTEMVTEEVVAFGQRVAAARQERGWSRVELARKLGISRERLAKWELGEHAPPLGLLIRLRRVLGVTLDELVTGERPANPAWTKEEQEELAACLEFLARFLERMGTQDDGGWSPGRTGP